MEKKIKYGKWNKENTKEARMELNCINCIQLYKRSIRESDCR